MYAIVFTEEAKKDIVKLSLLLEELRSHPRSGTGQVEQLKGYNGSVYSRRITKEHRLVYRVIENVVEVLIISAYGHYVN